MPQLIKHIDQIAREKQRDVLYLEFDPQLISGSHNKRYLFKKDPVRKKILEVLKNMGVTWQCCDYFANEYCVTSYMGQVYLDVPYDPNLLLYQKLESYLQSPDNTMSFKNVRFYVVPLSAAMKNAHHDEPGFWEKWAENF